MLLSNGYWEVRNTRKMGRGIFAKKDIVAGVVIGDYIGKVVRETDIGNYDKKGDDFYLMYYHDRASIYPDVKSTGIHVLNHSCTPNVWMYTYKGHTLYFSLRKVFKGEQLTVSYLLSPQDKECNPCDHLCSCGSVICPGNMHLSEIQYNKWHSLDDKQGKKTKAERVRYNTTLSVLSTYPQNIPDDPFYTLFGSDSKKPLILDNKILPTRSQLRNLIRQSGRTLKFKNLNTLVLGVTDTIIVSKPISSN